MRRVLFTLLLMTVTLTGMAQSIGDAMYVFRSDGQINGFLPGEIISIDYSDTDADRNKYDEIVTQIINTADSTYIIPLSVIDSISFVTPETVYQPGVINISEKLMPYVVNSEDLTITLSDATPSDIMPRVGDKLVTLEMNDKFPAGFIGEVETVAGKRIECKSLEWDEAFETYYNVSVLSGDNNNQPRGFLTRSNDDVYGRINLGKLTASEESVSSLFKTLDDQDEPAFGKGAKCEFSVTPTIHITNTTVIDKVHGKYINVAISGSFDIEEVFSIFGKLKTEFTILEFKKQWPLSAPMVFAYVNIGAKFESESELGIEFTGNQSVVWGAQFKYDSKSKSTAGSAINARLASESYDIRGSLDGEAFLGPYIEAGITLLNQKIDKISGEVKAGIKLEGDAVVHASELIDAERSTKLYERLKDASLSLDWVIEAEVEAKVAKWELKYELPWKIKKNIYDLNLVPSFSGTKLSQDNKGVYKATADVKDLNFMTKAGLKLVNIYNEDDAAKQYPEGVTEKLSCSFNANAEEEYKLFPIVKLLNIEMIATPADSLMVELCPDNNHPHVIDLGLPSGTKWSCCNVGASAPSVQGGLYAWGETSTKVEYHWGNYAYSIFNKDGEFTWTCRSIGTNIAGTQYDAATRGMGSRWKMPTSSQFNELIGNTRYRWTTVNGVPGARYLGKNHKAIFLPGYGQGVWIDYDSNFISMDHQGACGDYWSSNPSGAYMAYYLSANPVGSSVCVALYRGHGLAIRPITK